jgi:MFS superfamily sulfate permease-like transporter
MYAAVLGAIAGAILVGWLLCALFRLDSPWSVGFAGVVLSTLVALVVGTPVTQRVGPTVAVTAVTYAVCAAVFTRISPRFARVAGALVMLSGVVFLALAQLR